MRKQTTAINPPFARPDAYGSLAMPIYTNVSFEFQDAQEMADVFCNRVKAPDYARIANPTVTHFEQRVKALTGAEHVTAFNSGIAAISTTLFAVGYTLIPSKSLVAKWWTRKFTCERRKKEDGPVELVEI